MPWARMDDDFHDNGKILSLSHPAFRLYVCAITYCRRHRSAGFLTASQAWALCGQQRIARGAVKELVEKLAWHGDPTRSGYVIHDFAVYQPREDETAGERMRRFRQRGKAPHSHEAAVTTVTPAVTVREGYASVTRNGDAPVPIPIPIPSTTEGKPSVAPPAAPAPPRAVPKPGDSPRELSEHQALFEALAGEFGQAANEGERARYGKAAKLLRQAHVDPGELHRLVATARDRWGDEVDVTPLAIANGVTTLRTPRPAAPTARQNGRRSITDPIEQAKARIVARHAEHSDENPRRALA